MPGLGNNTGKFTYVNIKKGKLYVKRDNEVLAFDNIEGYLVGLEIRDDEYQGKKYKKLCLDIVYESDRFQLQMKLDSGYGNAFCRISPNIDPTLLLKITPTYQEVDGKGRAGMFINQGNAALKWAWTKENPGNLPQLEQVEFKGELHWDNKKQQEFFTNWLIGPNGFRSKLVHEAIAGPAHQFHDEKIPSAADITEPIDDLPF